MNIQTASENLQTAVCQATEAVRKILDEHNVGGIRLDIEIQGRVNAGDIRVSYRLGDGVYSSSSPIGYCLAVVVEEFLRRNGWEKRNAPLTLSAPKANDDDPPGEEPRAVDVAQF